MDNPIADWFSNNGWQPYDDNPHFRLFKVQDALTFCRLCGSHSTPILGGMTFRTGGEYICEGTGMGWDVEPLPGEDLNSFIARTVDEAEDFLNWFKGTPDASVQWIEVTPASRAFVVDEFLRRINT